MRSLKTPLLAGLLIFGGGAVRVASAAITFETDNASLQGVVSVKETFNLNGFSATDSSYLPGLGRYHDETLDLEAKGPNSMPAAATYEFHSAATGANGTAFILHLDQTLSASAKSAAECVAPVTCPATVGSPGVDHQIASYLTQFVLSDINYQLDFSALTSATFANAPPGAEFTAQVRFYQLDDPNGSFLYDQLLSYHSDGSVTGTPGGGPVSTVVGPGHYQLFYLLTFDGYTTTSIVPATLNYTGDIDLSVIPVPLPAAAWLMVSGLSGLAVFARRRRPTPTLITA